MFDAEKARMLSCNPEREYDGVYGYLTEIVKHDYRYGYLTEIVKYIFMFAKQGKTSFEYNLILVEWSAIEYIISSLKQMKYRVKCLEAAKNTAKLVISW